MGTWHFGPLAGGWVGNFRGLDSVQIMNSQNMSPSARRVLQVVPAFDVGSSKTLIGKQAEDG